MPFIHTDGLSPIFVLPDDPDRCDPPSYHVWAVGGGHDGDRCQCGANVAGETLTHQQIQERYLRESEDDGA